LPIDRCAGALYRPLSLGFFILFFILQTPAVSSQTTPETHPYYARTNSFGILVAYSGDSSHMLLGFAEQRKLLNIGVSYGRKLLQGRVVNWQYNGELYPVTLEGDPLSRFVVQQTEPVPITVTSDGSPPISCAPISTTFNYTDPSGVVHAGTASVFCHGRQWTVGEGMSPIGMQWNFLPHRAVQPLLIGHGGYMYSTQAIPISGAGSFNFTFDLGAGIEWYRSPSRSFRAEYRYHHISNHYTALYNPGIDNGLFQISYVFGR
jgi:opacity protein-like surface antigen